MVDHRVGLARRESGRVGFCSKPLENFKGAGGHDQASVFRRPACVWTEGWRLWVWRQPLGPPSP